jgi:hypothetical protein
VAVRGIDTQPICPEQEWKGGRCLRFRVFNEPCSSRPFWSTTRAIRCRQRPVASCEIATFAPQLRTHPESEFPPADRPARASGRRKSRRRSRNLGKYCERNLLRKRA